MTNPYQPPLPETEADGDSIPVWRRALAGWLVGLTAGAVATFPFFPWLHALLVTLMVGAIVSAIVQSRIVLQEMRR